MKTLATIFMLFLTFHLGAQSLDDGKSWAADNGIDFHGDHESFIGKADHAAPVIKTRDGGLAITGGYDEAGSKGVKVVLINGEKQVQWTHFFGPIVDNLEAQSVIEDRTGHFYIFIEVHNKKDDKDTRERVIKFDHSGKIQWDIALEKKENHYHRHCNTVKLAEDGKSLILSGTCQPDKTAIDNNEQYAWSGTLSTDGKLDQEVGDKLQ